MMYTLVVKYKCVLQILAISIFLLLLCGIKGSIYASTDDTVQRITTVQNEESQNSEDVALENSNLSDCTSENASMVSGQNTNENDTEPDCEYRTHVQDIGWQDWKKNGDLSGTQGQSKRLEGININVNEPDSDLGVTYRTHVQDIGWQDWKKDGALAGTTGKSKRLEAIQVKLTGKNADKYDVYYCTHVQNLGWLNWAKNGGLSGTSGYGYRLEAIIVKILKRGMAAPAAIGTTKDSYYSKDEGPELGVTTSNIIYNTHVQDIGWQDWKADGSLAGTEGGSKRIEALHIKLNDSVCNGNVQYRTHVQDYGWTGWKTDGALSGTTGESKRIEAIQIKLAGDIANYFDVYYCANAEKYGWLSWAKNGEMAGTANCAFILGGLKILLLPKNNTAPENLSKITFSFYDKESGPDLDKSQGKIDYTVYEAGNGWQKYSKDGATAGTTGQSRHLEGIHINVNNPEYAGNVMYRAHVQDIGWMDWKKGGELAGTLFKNKRLEAIQIKLTGDLAKYYDIYYRTHVQNIGWTAWTSDENMCGSSGFGYGLEAIEILLNKKDEEGPQNSESSRPFYSRVNLNIGMTMDEFERNVITRFRSGNYWEGNDPEYIVIHHWGNDGQAFSGVVNWLMNPASLVSANYVVEGGRCARLVDETNAAWHAGNRWYNKHSVGIECRPEMDSNTFSYVVATVAMIYDRVGKVLPVIGHKDVVATACPGRYYSHLQEIQEKATNIFNNIRAGGRSILL